MVDREIDPVVEAYKPGVDLTLCLENLKLTWDQRIEQLQSVADSYEEIAKARHTFRRGAANV